MKTPQDREITTVNPILTFILIALYVLFIYGVVTG